MPRPCNRARREAATSPSPSRLRRLIVARALLVALLGGAAIGAVGCNLAGPTLYVLSGPPKTPAAYELADRPTVVFVDDRRNALPRFELRGVICDEAIQTLMEAKVVTRGIDSREVLNLVRKQDTDKDLMPIDAIGKAAGAEQIIYVRLSAFLITPDGYTPRPVAGAEVRVIDVVSRERIFPAPDQEPARYLEASLDPVSIEAYQSSGSRRQIEDTLARQLGREVAELFFDHDRKEIGRNLK